MMTDKGVDLLCKSMVLCFGIVAITIIAIFYRGDAAMLIGLIMTSAGSFWTFIQSKRNEDKLDTVNVKQDESHTKLDANTKMTEQVVSQTNGLVGNLVKEAEKAGVARGVLSRKLTPAVVGKIKSLEKFEMVVARANKPDLLVVVPTATVVLLNDHRVPSIQSLKPDDVVELDDQEPRIITATRAAK